MVNVRARSQERKSLIILIIPICIIGVGRPSSASFLTSDYLARFTQVQLVASDDANPFASAPVAWMTNVCVCVCVLCFPVGENPEPQTMLPDSLSTRLSRF